MKKRWFWGMALVVFAVIFMNISFVVKAQEEGPLVQSGIYNGLTWKVTGKESNGYTLSFEGKGAIGMYETTGYLTYPWGKYNLKVKEVKIGSGVTGIGDQAFYQFAVMEKVEIPASVTRIGKSAFESCESLKSIVIPKGVTVIPSSVFAYCSKLESVSIPDTVTEIKEFAFWRCESLTNASIPASVKMIRAQAFSKCQSVFYEGTECELQKVQEVRDPVLFGDDEILVVARYPHENFTESVISDNGYESTVRFTCTTCQVSYTLSYSGDWNAAYLAKYEGDVRTLILPQKVQDRDIVSIDGETFYGCENLVTVVLPDTVKEIAYSAFYNCPRLSKVVLPYGLQTFYSTAFKNCGNLRSIQIPSSVTEITDFIWENSSWEYVNGEPYESFTIYADKGSYAAQYAGEYGYSYKLPAGNALCHGGEATCVARAVCDTCKEEYGEYAEHDYATYWDKDDTMHWHHCCNCDEKTGLSEHKIIANVQKASMTADGMNIRRCAECDWEKYEYLPTIKSVTLDAAVYTYDGKAKKPAVIIKNAWDEIIDASNYTVTYPTGRKNVGQYTVNVTFKGNYSGKKSLTFKINPPKTAIKTVTAASKAFKLSWNKKTAQVEGYEIQYSRSSAFKSGNKTVAVKKNSTVSQTIGSLTAKKKYYVRIRTFKTVNGKKYVSEWSEAKSVTTKK